MQNATDRHINGAYQENTLPAELCASPSDPHMKPTSVPRIVIELITPDRAIELLSNKAPNRNLSKLGVGRLVSEIQHGNWHLNGETIKINTNGQLCDGQHRLEALLETETPLYMAVAYNVPPEAHQTIDIGRRRTIADAATIDGHAFPRTRAGIAKLLCAYDRYVAEVVKRNREELPTMKLLSYLTEISTKDTLTFMAQHAALLDIATEASREMQSATGLGIAQGTAYAVLYRVDPEKADTFKQCMTTGLFPEDGSCQQLHVLRETLMRERRASRKLMYYQTFGLCIKAIHFWLQGVHLTGNGVMVKKNEAFPYLEKKRAGSAAMRTIRNRKAKQELANINSVEAEELTE